jgi:hypothetical protein
MSHFAQVIDGVVTQVIVAEQDVIDSGLFGEGWIQTSYNTFHNQHPEGRPLRGNYATIGGTYDAQNDVFIPPTIYPSWVLNTTIWDWKAPIPRPEGPYWWNEPVQQWILEPTPPSSKIPSTTL